MNYRKKMIEVALPLEAINKAAAREKSIRHGHPSTLHLWWARRPLAACRAVLFASLVDDPDSDPEYRKPNGKVDEEKAGAKRAELFNLIEDLVQWENSNNPKVINKARAEIARCVASRKIELGELDKATVVYEEADAATRGRGDAANGEAGAEVDAAKGRGGEGAKGGKAARTTTAIRKGELHPKGPISGDGVTAYEVVLMRARPEVVNAFLAEYAPPVLDPFCGGGSIPLEAQRLGLRAYGSDLNPVPVLITKALIEIPPKFAGKPPVNPKSDKKMVWNGAEGLAEDVRYYGKWMRDEAEKRIGHLYPKVKITKEMAKDRTDLKRHVGEELTVIAWLWARTVASPNPALGGTHVPLVRSFWLSTKPGQEAWIEPVVNAHKDGYRFEVRVGLPPDDHDPKRGTVVRTGGTCLLSGESLPFEHIRSEGKAGRIGAKLMAIVAEGAKGRVYLPPLPDHETIASIPMPDGVPDTSIPEQALSFRVQLYGMDKHYKLFTNRQLTVLVTLSDLVSELRGRVLHDAKRAGMLPSDERSLEHDGVGDQAYADSLATYLSFAIDKSSEGSTTLCTWSPLPTKLHVVSTFGRQALPMIWDFAESNLFADSSGNFERMASLISEVIGRSAYPCAAGTVRQVDAVQVTPDTATVISTDPPYYDNIGYADLSDFFYVWLRRSLSGIYPALLSTVLTPKAQELIATRHRHNDSIEAAKQFFEAGLTQCFEGTRRAHSSEVPFTIFYAFKQAEDDGTDSDADVTGSVASTGWETILEAVIQSGFLIDGTWPMRTERTGGFRNKGQNALASSVVLSCRARLPNAPLATRREFLKAIKQELPEALKNLQRGSIAPVDLAQAAIGPGMAVFTRYTKVMETDGRPMSVRTALGLINQALDEVLAEQEAEFDSDTRWALAWFEQFGMEEGAFGVAETLSKAKNTAINGLVEAGVIKARSGKVRLLKRDELPDNWNPSSDKRLTIWEVTQHLIRTLDQKGESGAADLVRKLGGTAEIARDLAYRLYTICERKKWADEALAYNGLVIAWPELTKLAMAVPAARTERQSELFT